MDRASIETLLNEVSAGRTAVNEALDRLRDLPFEDIGFAKLDHHRLLRTGMPEVIFASGKTVPQVAAIFARMAQGAAMFWQLAPLPTCFAPSAKWNPVPSFMRPRGPLL